MARKHVGDVLRVLGKQFLQGLVPREGVPKEAVDAHGRVRAWESQAVEGGMVRDDENLPDLLQGMLEMCFQRSHDLGGKSTIVERPADKAGIVVLAAKEALAAKALLPIRQLAAQAINGPGVIVPVDRTNQR